jgi:class 3 adenylate cyclase
VSKAGPGSIGVVQGGVRFARARAFATVNLASRLARVAVPGTVAVDAHLAAHHPAAQSQGRVRLKGLGEVGVWRVTPVDNQS